MIKTVAPILLAALLWSGQSQGAADQKFAVKSSSFTADTTLPSPFAGPGECGGANKSPALSWTEAPPNARSFAVVMFDPGAMNGKGFVHWVAYDIAAPARSLPEDVGATGSGLFVSGVNSLHKTGYFGPCPPPGSGTHHYVFTVYALDLPTGSLKPGASRDELLQQIAGHVLAQAEITGLYQRQ